MGDASDGAESWAKYIGDAAKRPGWSVARLAREASVHRSTLFRYIKGQGGSVTVDTVQRIATALGDPPQLALRAAGNLLAPDDSDDEEMAIINEAPVSEAAKERMRDRLRQLRDRDRQQRMADLHWLIDQEQTRDVG